MNEILVYTQQDCNDLCGILARNGYCTVAYQILNNMSSSIIPKNWCIQYYNPQEVKKEEHE